MKSVSLFILLSVSVSLGASQVTLLQTEPALGRSCAAVLGAATDRTRSVAQAATGDTADAYPGYPDIAQTYAQVLEMENVHSDIPLLSIVIPAYREELRLPPSLKKIQRFLAQFPLSVEVLAVIEKSPDNTVEAARAVVGNDPQIQVIDNQVQRGKGYAVRSGMLRARGQYVLFMDADLSTPLPEILNFLLQFKTHPEAQVLIGDRWSDGPPPERSLLRRGMTSVFGHLVRAVAVKDIDDTQCGFKAFTQAAARDIFARQTLNGFSFDVEVLILAEQLGYKIAAQPVQWFDDARTTVGPLDPLWMARDLILMRSMVRRNLRQSTSSQPTLPLGQPSLAR
jgi:dolichyl-phosphate beta-glucosyltransferase